MAHGGNGFTLGVAAKLKKNTAFKYLHEVSALIADKLKDKWMGSGYVILVYFSNLQHIWKIVDPNFMLDMDFIW